MGIDVIFKTNIITFMRDGKQRSDAHVQATDETKGPQHYEQVRIGKKTVSKHRFVWEKAHGPLAPGMVIHHMDGNKRNNAL